MMGPAEYLRVAADPVRLAVLGRAAVGRVDPEALAGELGVSERKVRSIVGRLVNLGLLGEDHTLDRDALRMIARQIPQDPPVDPDLIAGGWTEEEARTLGTFFTGSRLKSIPTQRAKRLVVLERLAQEFEPGRRYQEKEVNFTLQLFYSDYAALRRYLVDEELMTRADGVYWRTGGRFPSR